MAMKMLGTDVSAMGALEGMKDARNAALVYVEVTLPPAGVAAGDKVACRVYAAGATKKSLNGAVLVPTPLFEQTPTGDVENRGVYALASGPVSIDAGNPLSGTIDEGCQMQVTMMTPMEENGVVTLLVDSNHTSWNVAPEIASAINASFFDANPSSSQGYARVINARAVAVTIPQYARNSVATFIGDIMQTALSSVPKIATVVINESTGTVVIDPEVEIDATVFSVPGINVEIGPPVDNFSAFDPQASINPNEYRTAKLQALVDALNAIKVPSDQIISIIKTLDDGGKIHGQVKFVH